MTNILFVIENIFTCLIFINRSACKAWSCCVIELYSSVVFLLNPTQSSKKDEKRNGDIIPPSPFCMRPTGLTLYMRQKLGSAAIQKSARSSVSPINVKDIPKPTGISWWHVLIHTAGVCLMCDSTVLFVCFWFILPEAKVLLLWAFRKVVSPGLCSAIIVIHRCSIINTCWLVTNLILSYCTWQTPNSSMVLLLWYVKRELITSFKLSTHGSSTRNLSSLKFLCVSTYFKATTMYVSTHSPRDRKIHGGPSQGSP